jgi:hypothetical protein
MRRTTSARLTLMVGVVVVAVAGCGGSDDPSATDGPPTSGAVSDRDAYVAAAAEQMAIGDDDLSTCLTGAVVDAIGMDEIAAAGLTPADFARASSLEEMGVPTTLEDPEGLQDQLTDCGDLVGVFAADDRLGDETECVTDGLTNDLAAETIVVDLTGAAPSEELAAARDAISSCILAEATPGT